MLRFIYGVMGSSKSAQALMTKFNYEQNGFEVVLLKPSIDTRSEEVASRIGLKAKCKHIKPADNLLEMSLVKNWFDRKIIVIVDEAQFCTRKQINQLKRISEYFDVFCYGLKTNFKSELFEGSKRLLEIADSVEQIHHICKCGKPAEVSARFVDGKVALDGEEVQIGDTEYKPLCYKCWEKELENVENFENIL